MSTDTWDEAIDAAAEAGRELGRIIAAWKNVPKGDGTQLINEATDCFRDEALDAFRQALAADLHGPECEDDISEEER